MSLNVVIMGGPEADAGSISNLCNVIGTKAPIVDDILIARNIAMPTTCAILSGLVTELPMILNNIYTNKNAINANIALLNTPTDISLTICFFMFFYQIHLDANLK